MFPEKMLLILPWLLTQQNLLHKNIYDVFVIVSSDSDYTPLAIKLHESGVYVIGVDERKIPDSFKNSCDEFIYLENLQLKNDDGAIKCDEIKPDINEIHRMLKTAYDTYKDDDDYAYVSSARCYIKRIKPDFDCRTYGYVKLSELIADFSEKYEIKKCPSKGNITIMAYKCK